MLGSVCWPLKTRSGEGVPRVKQGGPGTPQHVPEAETSEVLRLMKRKVGLVHRGQGGVGDARGLHFILPLTGSPRVLSRKAMPGVGAVFGEGHRGCAGEDVWSNRRVAARAEDLCQDHGLRSRWMKGGWREKVTALGSRGTQICNLGVTSWAPEGLRH